MMFKFHLCSIVLISWISCFTSYGMGPFQASVDKWAEDLDKILGNVDVGDGYGLSWVMYHMVDYCQEKKFTGQVKRLQATISLLDSDQINWDKAFMVAERILEECKQTWGATGRFGG